MIKIGFIGAGNMGSALARAISLASDTEVYIYDKDESKAIKTAEKIGGIFARGEQIAKECDFVFLAVKPNILKSAIDELLPYLKERKLYTIVSMAAGVKISKLEEYFAYASPAIIRIMPNTPVAVSEGTIVWCANESASETQKRNFEKIMEHSGLLDAIDEKLFDAATAVSGCGPAFVYMFIDAIAKAGCELGLSRESALKYASQTLKGASEMVNLGESTPEVLRDNVCSPGGSTIEGVRSLMSDSFEDTVKKAVFASYNKTVELGK